MNDSTARDGKPAVSPVGLNLERVTAKNVDLTNCDRELVQYSGAVQPHCALLSVREPDLLVIQSSTNFGELLDLGNDSVTGENLSALLDADELEELQLRIGSAVLLSPIHVMRISRPHAEFHLFAHRIDGVLVLEFERCPPATEGPLDDLYAELRNHLSTLQEARSLDEFFDQTVRKVQAFTGFDRVLAYKFLPDKSGEVIAEAKLPNLESYLGLHYPASDIPDPARRLFSMLWLRHLPNSRYTPCPVVPEINSVSGAPLDLSYVAGRSVSEMYSKYLQNMGVQATLVITLFKEGRVWGLLSCMHHSAPKHVPYDIRIACEFLGHMVSSLMAARENEFHQREIAQLREHVSRLVNQMSTAEPYFRGMIDGPVNALSLLNCGGAAVVYGREVAVLGACPTTDHILELTAWLETQLAEKVIFQTDRLSTLIPNASDYRDVASGLLAISIGRIPRTYALWFRPEMPHTVKWAGDPNKPVDVVKVGGEERLTPRSSFAVWKEEARGRSEPWADYEIATMQELQRSTADVIAKRSEQLRSLNRELQISNIELDSFAYAASHDLKEPLRGIHNFAALIMRRVGDSLDPDSRAKMQTIQRLTQRMDELIEALLHFSRIGRAELVYRRTDLNEVLEQALEMLSSRIEETKTEIRIPRPLPVISCDPVGVREVFVNLLSNGIKFNDKPTRWLEIGFTEGALPTLWVADNGIGIETDDYDNIFRIFRRLHPREDFGGGTGAGLTIVRKIVERHGGRVWVESSPGYGSKFFVQLAAAEHASA